MHMSARFEGDQGFDVHARLATTHRRPHRSARQQQPQNGRSDPEDLSQLAVAEHEGDDTEPEQHDAGDEFEDLAVLA